MSIDVLLHPFRPIRARHLTLMRQVASIQHGLLDQSTALGYLWSLLHPLLLLAVLYIFFSRRVGEGIEHYAIFLLIGLVQFTHFSKATSSGMRVLTRMRGLVTSVIFPKDVLVYSALLAVVPEFLISMGAVIVLALLSGVPPTWTLLLVPVVIVLQLLLVLWTTLFLAILYAFVRDLDHLYDVGMRLLFFATPIIYTLDFLPAGARRLALLNPLAHVMGYARALILGGQGPRGGQLVAFFLLNLLLCYAGIAVFRRAEPALVERM